MSPMGRLCERPGCSERGDGLRVRRRSAARVARRLRSRRRAPRAGRCASATPTRWSCRVGWTLDDTRDPEPPLFRAADDAAQASTAPPQPATAAPRRRRARPTSCRCRPSRARPSPRSPAPIPTIPTPPWPSRGCRRSTSATTSTACCGAERHCSPGPSGARPAALTAPMKATITESFPGATAGDCSTTSPRSTATRRGCASSTGSTPLTPDDRSAGVVGRAARPGRAVRPLQAAAHGAHRVRRQRARRRSSASRTTSVTTPSGSCAASVAPATSTARR